MEKPQELSKKDRRALEKEAKKHEAQKKLQAAKRRRLAGAGLAGGAFVIAIAGAIGSIVSRQNSTPSDVPSSNQTEEPYGENAWRLIRKEIEISPEYRNISDKDRMNEADLWYGVSQAYPDNIPDDPEEKRNAVIEIVAQTIYAMGASRNPYFNHAYEVISEQIAKGKLDFDTYPLGGAYAKTGAGQDNNGLFWGIIYDTDKVLQDRSPVNLALIITHETVHLKQGLELRKEHAYLSPSAFLDFDQAFHDIRENNIHEESLAYAEGARAFMFSTALIQQYAASEDLTPMIDAAYLIRCKKEVESDCWQGYIASQPERLLEE